MSKGLLPMTSRLHTLLMAATVLIVTAMPHSVNAQVLGVKSAFHTGYGVDRIERVDDIDAHPLGGYVTLDANHGLASKFFPDGSFDRIVANADDTQGSAVSPDIRSIAIDRHGFVYATTSKGVARFQPDGTFDTFFDPISVDVVDSAVDTLGRLLVLTPESIIQFSRSGHVLTVVTNIANSGNNPVSAATSITALPNGNIVLLHRDGHLCLLDSKFRQVRDVTSDQPMDAVRTFSDNRVAVAFTSDLGQQGFRILTSGLDKVKDFFPSDVPLNSKVFDTASTNRLAYAGSALSRVLEVNSDTSAVKTFHSIVDTMTEWDHGNTPLKVLDDLTVMVWNYRIGTMQTFAPGGELINEYAVANDGNVFHAASSGRFYIRPLNDTNQIYVYSPTAQLEGIFGISTVSGFSRVDITAIGTDAAGDIYAVDQESGYIRHLNALGIDKRKFKVVDGTGAVSDTISSMHVSPDGHVTLLFAGGSLGHIDVYNASGVLEHRRMGNDTSLRLYGSLDVAANGDIVVLNTDDYLGIGYVLAPDLTTQKILTSVISPSAIYNGMTTFSLNSVGDIFASTAFSARIFHLTPIESTPPRTEFTFAQYPNANLWYKTPVSVILAGFDAERAWDVSDITYQLDIFAPLTTPGNTVQVDVSNDGEHSIIYYSTDIYGNTDSAQVLLVRVDTKPPVSVAALRNSGASVAITATDTTSGVDSIWYLFDQQPAKRYTGPITLDGAPHTIRYWAIDSAGNSEGVKSFTTTLAPSAIVADPSTAVGGTNIDAELRINGTAGVGGVRLNLTSNNTALTAPTTATILEGQSAVTVRLTTKPVVSDTTVTITASIGLNTVTTKVLITRTRVSGVVMTPAQVNGGSIAQGVVTLNGAAPTGGSTVVLQSNRSAATVPGTVGIAAGQTSATFQVSTSPVTVDISATISATYGGNTAAADLVVTKVSLSSLTLSRTSVIGGSSRNATITLTGPAPSGGLQVSLASDQVAVITPSTVLVPSGQSKVTATLTTTPVPELVTAVIRARVGTEERSAVLEVLPPTATLRISPAIITGGNTASGILTLDTKAPAAGLVVLLSADDSHVAVPPSVTISGGKTTATFVITTTPVIGETSCNVTASVAEQVSNASLLLRPVIAKSIVFTPSSVRGGTPANMVITLDAPAPATGVTLDVYATNAVVKVPATVTIPSGQTSVTLAVSTEQVVNNIRVPVVVTTGSNSATGALTVTGAEVTGITLTPATVTGGKPSTGLVTLSSPAPVGGYIVTLVSSLPNDATVGVSVLVAAGKTTGTFPVTTKVVNVIKTPQITASLNGVSKVTSLTVTPPGVTSVTIAPASVVGGVTAVGTVKLASVAVGDVRVVLTSSLQGVASVPTSVIVKNGAASAVFTVSTTKQTVQKIVSIGAVTDGVAKFGSLTVKP